MSRVPSRPARAAVRSVASSPAVAGFRPAAIAVAAAFALGAHAQSVPIGAVHGTATFQRNGDNLLITTTNGAGHRSVINWQTFGVPLGSTTYFRQPDAASTSINRVLGGLRSDIMGYLGSNGRLVLVNGAGIAVGANAIIDTAGFTASSLFLSEEDAINGRLLFEGGLAGITIGEGARILAHGGDIVLIGSQVQVERNAVIQADGATILAAGEKVEVTGRGLEGIRMEVQAGNEAVNLGTLQGDAVGIFAGTLKHSGLVRAQAVTAGGGKVVLKAIDGDNLVDGTVIASAQGGKGGSIDVLGKRVALLAGADVDASGTSGGGSIRIGGDYQGANADVPNAQAVYVDAAASIKADAGTQGDGGRVIVWSDGLTQMHGQVSARGGTQGGDGGFAEVSGKKVLAFTGRADLRAARGRTGTLLLDPNDIVIDASAATDTPSSTPAPAVWQYSGGASTSTIKESDLEAQLANSNVVVLTNGGTGGNGDITVNAGVDIGWSGAYTLALQADRNIVLNGKVTATNASSVLSMQALGGNITQGSGSTVTVGGLLANAKGNVTMTGANMVDRLSGNTTLSGANGNFTFNNGKDITLGTVSTAWGGSFNGINAGSGDVKVTTTAGNITVAAPPPASTLPPVPSGVIGRNVTLEAKSAVNLQGNVTASGLAKIKALMGAINQYDTSTVKAGSIDLHASGDVTLSGGVASRGGINVTSDNGGITFTTISARGEEDSGPEIHGGNVTLKAKGDINGNEIDADGGYGYDESGEIGGNGGVVKVTSDAGGIDIGTIYASAGGSTDAATAGNAGKVTLTAKTASRNVSVWDVQANGGDGHSGTKGGSINIEAGGDISFSSIYAFGGDSSQDVGGQGGDIHLRAGGSTFFAGEGGLLSASEYYGGVQAVGGAGGTDTSTGNGLRGGKGGLVEINATAGDLVTDGSWLVAADGGAGGDGMGGTAGGRGGDGGEIKLLAKGRVVLDSPRIYAKGGVGGTNPDESSAASGVNGIFRAMGTSVDVISNFELNADWFNDSIVKVMGASEIYGYGLFRNDSDVQLFDTARLNAYNGFVNAGRFSTFGDNEANLTLNTSTGLVEVVAGSTLSTPAFLLNQGMVKVDGTLRTADPLRLELGLLLQALPTTGPLFTNEAGGTLAGTGTLVVGAGTGTVQNFGTIAPGGIGTIGTLTLDASLMMESGSTYAADLLNAGSHDRLVVTGSAKSGGNFAVNYLSGAAFAAGDSFTMMQTGGLDATTLPGVDQPELKSQASGNDLLLVATAGYPPAPAPMLPPDVEDAVQQSNNQVVTFADLFVKMAEEQDKDRIGKDDIVITDTACTR